MSHRCVTPVTTCDPSHMVTLCAWDCTLSIPYDVIACQSPTQVYWDTWQRNEATWTNRLGYDVCPVGYLNNIVDTEWRSVKQGTEYTVWELSTDSGKKQYMIIISWEEKLYEKVQRSVIWRRVYMLKDLRIKAETKSNDWSCLLSLKEVSEI